MIKLYSMQVKRSDVSSTKVKLNIIPDLSELVTLRDAVLSQFQKSVKVPGFRQGKAPLGVIEKHLDSAKLQTEFVDQALNSFYFKAIGLEKLKPIGTPNISISKFVPFTTLEFDAEVDTLGNIKLANYKQIKKKIIKAKVEAKDIDDVIDKLRTNMATKTEVSRLAKLGDEVVIDFSGKDSKNQPIKGADGKDYALLLGSKAFIPGFEDNLVGLQPKEEKTFSLKFPKDYGAKELSNKKVTFTVKINKINEVIKPNLDAEFAQKIGPFKTVAELKADIKKHLIKERQKQKDQEIEHQIVSETVDKSTVDLPESLVNQQIERLKKEVRQNLTYRGQTWQEMLDAEGLNEDQFASQQLKPEAERRVKTGLVLSEISLKENLDVTKEELNDKIDELKAQYSDPTMQEELAKPEARQEIASRMVTEKTVKRLVEIATS